MARLTLTFEVNDDLTSERAADYRGLVVRAVDEYIQSCESGAGPGDYELGDKLLWDVYRQPGELKRIKNL